ncbi:unnamed protein product [Choristocarpus tenellus]
MGAHAMGIATWVVSCLAFATHVIAQSRSQQLCPAQSTAVCEPEDENRVCNLRSACLEEFSEANWSLEALWPDTNEETRKARTRCEKSRIALNRNQPVAVPKFTEVGYLKSRVPEETFAAIRDWHSQNVGTEKVEKWLDDNTYVNHWKVPTYMIRVPHWLKEQVQIDMQMLMEEWAGVTLKPTSLYGVRHYHRGAVLAAHVDRVETHVISAIINVAQDVDNRWPLFVRGHDGVDQEIFIEPGDMILYESASVIHGRPTPFNGEFFANLFLHYAPTEGWNIRGSDISRN